MKTMTIFKSVMMVAFVALFSTSIISCGGDDGDEPEQTPGVETGVINPNAKPKTNFEYFVPYTGWYTDVTQADTYMKNNTSFVNSYTNSVGTEWWSTTQPQIVTTYYFKDGKMWSLDVTYKWYDKQDLEYLVAQTQKKFNVKMNNIYTTDEGILYTGTFKVDGHEIGVTVMGMPTFKQMQVTLHAVDMAN